MTRSVDIDFNFHKSIDVATVLRNLLGSGMQPSVDGDVTYLIDEEGMFEWQKVTPSRLNEVVSLMADPQHNERTVGITLLFPESDHGGDMLFHPGRDSISYVASVKPKLLPNSASFCDTGWYLARLIPLFEPLGLAEIETRDSP